MIIKKYKKTHPERVLTANLSASELIQVLKDGNQRFINQNLQNQNLQNLFNKSCKGQNPFITILGCVDSRVPHEIVFDLHKGDVFSIRIAGNIVNDDISGSLEFASGVKDTKLIVILGHTDCGAVKAAMHKNSVPTQFSNLHTLINKIKVKNANTLDQNIIENVVNSVNIVESNLHKKKIMGVKVVGAVYNVCTGKVNFL